MLFKYLFKNIFAKPGRLIVIMICMIVACFAGFLALDLGSTLGEAFDDFGAKYVGGADYLIVYFGTGRELPMLYLKARFRHSLSEKGQ